MAKTKKESTEVKAKETGAVALAFDMGDDAGAGLENADRDSFAIPFLTVIQKTSPQMDETDGKFIEGARAGELFNSVTQRRYDGKEGVLFMPCVFERVFIHWGPRGTKEGGFKGELTPDEAMRKLDAGDVREINGRLWFVDENNEVNEKKSDYLSDTRNHFGIVYNPETGEMASCLISLTSTQIKKSKQLVSMLDSVKVRGKDGQMVTPPTWANLVRITTVPESNDQGSWHGVRFQLEGFVDSQAVYDAGRKLYEAIKDRGAKVNYAEQAGADQSATNGKF